MKLSQPFDKLLTNRPLHASCASRASALSSLFVLVVVHHVETSSRYVAHVSSVVKDCTHQYEADLIMCRRQPGIGEHLVDASRRCLLIALNCSHRSSVREVRRQVVRISLRSYLIYQRADFSL